MLRRWSRRRKSAKEPSSEGADDTGALDRGPDVHASVRVAQADLAALERGVLGGGGDARVRNSMQVQKKLLELRQAMRDMQQQQQDAEEPDGTADTARNSEPREAAAAAEEEAISQRDAERVLRATDLVSQLQQASAEAARELALDGAPVRPAPNEAPNEAPRRPASVQFRSPPRETIRAARAPTRRLERLTRNDCLYGETAMIDGLWVFARALDPDHVRAGVAALLDECPTLAGRVDSLGGAVRLSNAGVPFTVQYATGGAADVPEDPHPRGDWLDKREQEAVWAGREPVLTVCLTQLRQGGSVLGISVSHGVAGGAGWFGVVLPRLAAHVRVASGQLESVDALPAGALGSVRPVESREAFPARAVRTRTQLRRALAERAGAVPLDFSGPVVGALKRSVFYALLRSAQDRPRVMEHFPPEELDAIKDAASANLPPGAWLSTGEALAAHLSRIMSAEAPRGVGLTPTHMACICDHAGRLRGNLPPGLLANSFYVYSVPFPRAPHKMPLGELALLVHDRLQRALGDRDAMLQHMALQEELLEHGFQPNPELSLELPIVFNNQAKFLPLVQLDFGTGVCARYVPHRAGDSILCVPAADGGVNAWLSTVNALVGDASSFARADVLEKIHAYRP